MQEAVGEGMFCVARWARPLAGGSMSRPDADALPGDPTSRALGMTQAGNGSMRTMAIEMAWGWVRLRPRARSQCVRPVWTGQHAAGTSGWWRWRGSD